MTETEIGEIDVKVEALIHELADQTDKKVEEVKAELKKYIVKKFRRHRIGEFVKKLVFLVIELTLTYFLVEISEVLKFVLHVLIYLILTHLATIISRKYAKNRP